MELTAHPHLTAGSCNYVTNNIASGCTTIINLFTAILHLPPSSQPNTSAAFIAHFRLILNILNEYISIIYAGLLSGGIAFTLQIFAQKNISPAPSAIIFSLEGVFAAVAAWIILNEILSLGNILGCAHILIGVILSQILPSINNSIRK